MITYRAYAKLERNDDDECNDKKINISQTQHTVFLLFNATSLANSNDTVNSRTMLL